MKDYVLEGWASAWLSVSNITTCQVTTGATDTATKLSKQVVSTRSPRIDPILACGQSSIVAWIA
jgi:hypothetical protein